MRLEDGLHHIADRIMHEIAKDNDIGVITHTDADGIIAGSIIAKMLLRKNARFTVRTVSDMNDQTIDSIKDKHEFYIITDLGAGFANKFEEAFKDSWVVLDHHQLPDEEMDNDNVLNVWKYGIDGGKEVCAGSLCYLLAEHIDARNRDLSALAIVSAVADRQDQGDKKSLLGLNKNIADTARTKGLLSIDLDLMLVGRETRPIHEALAYTSFPYIEGLTWNPSSCLSLLTNAGIKLKDNGRWRVLAELDDEEKKIMLEAIAKFVAVTSNATNIIDDLIGYIYTLLKEDNRSMLRDAREFATLLNATARIGKAGVGISICLGDRNSMLKEGEQIVNEYRNRLREYMNTLMQDRWRIRDDGKVAFVNGESLIAEDMLGAVSSLLSSSPSMHGRLVIVWTRTKDDTYKFSSRKSLQTNSNANLGLIMRECSSKVGGSGGGHAPAAGARIPGNKLQEFLECLKASIDAAD
ncbi:MAG: recombinase RecJ [Candidatus Nitrosocaldaceae archaeon]|nr:MAG: recombinase RecJ [Candidatus Nitrosocaldaceae archaeon]